MAAAYAHLEQDVADCARVGEAEFLPGPGMSHPGHLLKGLAEAGALCRRVVTGFRFESAISPA